MYNSQYYTCEQIDQRLLRGYLDDYNSQNNTNLTKAEFLTLLFNTIGRNGEVDDLVTKVNSLGFAFILNHRRDDQYGRLSYAYQTNMPNRNIYISIHSPLADDTYQIFGCNDDGTLNTSVVLTKTTKCGTYTKLTIPSNGYLWFYCSKNTGSSDDIYNIMAFDEDTVLFYFENITNEINNSIYGETIYTENRIGPSSGHNRLSYKVNLNTTGDAVAIVNSTIEGDKYQLFGCNDDGTINNSVVLTSMTDCGTMVQFTVPENQMIWVYTQGVAVSNTKYDVIIIADDKCLFGYTLKNKKNIADLDKQVSIIDYDIYNENSHIERHRGPSSPEYGSKLSYKVNLNLIGDVAVLVNSTLTDDTYQIFGCNDDGTLNTSVVLTKTTKCGTPNRFTVPENQMIWVYTTAQLQDRTQKYDVIVVSIECLFGYIFKNGKNIADINDNISIINSSVYGSCYHVEKQRNPVSNYGRLSYRVNLDANAVGEITVLINSTIEGDKYQLFGCNDDGTINTSVVLTRAIPCGTTGQFTVPENKMIWIYTSKSAVTGTKYDVILVSTDSLIAKQIILDFSNDYLFAKTTGYLISEEKRKSPSSGHSRLSYKKNLDATGEAIIFINSTIEGDRYELYGCNDDGTINTSVKLTSTINCGTPSLFTIPENQMVWVFTIAEQQDRTQRYDVIFNSVEDNNLYRYIVKNIEDIKQLKDEVNGGVKLLKGKKIVCLGDSITEFKGPDGKNYASHLASMSGAEVIAAGIGGTQLRQRTQPVLNPTNASQAYAGVDIINMVNAACGIMFDSEHSFADVVLNAAEYLRDNVSDNNMAIINRFLAIDWQTIDYVTIFAGTNDWTGSTSTNEGISGSDDINTTLGAINKIIEILLTTYPHLHVYWFTPILRVQVPDFSTTKSYNVDDVCKHSTKYYKFISNHQGAWDDSDVVEITVYEARKPEYFSDIKTYNNKTLKQFAQDIYNEVKLNHITACDLYNNLGWNRYNFSQYFDDTDGTHPYRGFKDLAEHIYKFIYSN